MQSRDIEATGVRARATRHTYSSLSKAKPKQQQPGPEDEELESAGENSAPGQGLDGVPGCRAENLGSGRGHSLGALEASAVSAAMRAMWLGLLRQRHRDACSRHATNVLCCARASTLCCLLRSFACWRQGCNLTAWPQSTPQATTSPHGRTKRRLQQSSLSQKGCCRVPSRKQRPSRTDRLCRS